MEKEKWDQLAEAFSKLSPEDQSQYLSDLQVYGRAGIYVADDGRVRLLTPEALAAEEAERERVARAQSDPKWAEKIRKGEV